MVNVQESIAAQFDPLEMSDPFPFYDLARKKQPIFYDARIGYWVVTRYEDVKSIFKDLETFSSAISGTPMIQPPPEVQKILDDGGVKVYSGLSGRMPPDHTRIRSFINKAFTPQRIRSLETPIRARVDELLDGFTGGRADIVRQLTYDLPALVLFMLLGIPDEDVPNVKRWAYSRIVLQWGYTTPGQDLTEHAHNLVKYWKYCNDLIDKRFEKLQDDLPSDLVRIYNAGDKTITRMEMATVCYTLLFAGHETTSHTLAESIKSLLSPRTYWEELCRDPGKIPHAVEELARYCPSIFTWRRITTRPVTLGGVALPAGAPLLMVIGSANRDDQVFPDGNTLDLERENAKENLTFGYGVKYCLGSPLARLEMRVALEELTQRFPSLRLAPNQTIEYLPNMMSRGPLHVWVEWDA
jgi:cytochrome P450